jgi:hypothetical protein
MEKHRVKRSGGGCCSLMLAAFLLSGLFETAVKYHIYKDSLPPNRKGFVGYLRWSYGFEWWGNNPASWFCVAIGVLILVSLLVMVFHHHNP